MKSIKFLLLLTILILGCGESSKREEGEKPMNEPAPVEKEVEDEKIIMFYGNSITAGYGVSPDQAFPAIVQHIIDSLDYPYKVVNAGLSGETSAGGLNRIDWVLRTVPDIFVLELGGNDGLRGLQLSETKQNLAGIIKKVEGVNPDTKIILAGMEVPPNLGQDYTAEFRGIFSSLAAENDVIFIPFILEGVGGEPELMQSDGIHPNVEGHEIVAKIVWKHLAPLLEKNTLGEGV